MKRINWIKKIKAFGLAEVLIGLAITGGVLITITSVALSAYKQVKNNELADHANSILLMPIEYLKTPVDDVNKAPATYLNYVTNNGGVAIYKISSYLDSPPSDVRLSLVLTSDKTDLTTCDSGSLYSLSYSAASQIKTQLCGKILIEALSNGTYRITSSIAYKNFTGGIVASKIIGYRQKL